MGSGLSIRVQLHRSLSCWYSAIETTECCNWTAKPRHHSEHRWEDPYRQGEEVIKDVIIHFLPFTWYFGSCWTVALSAIAATYTIHWSFARAWRWGRRNAQPIISRSSFHHHSQKDFGNYIYWCINDEKIS